MSSSPMLDVASPQDAATSMKPAGSAMPRVLISLPAAGADALPAMMDHLVEALPGLELLLTAPDVAIEPETGRPVRMVPYPALPPHAGWVLTSTDYVTAASLLREHNAEIALLLGPEAASLSREALRALCASVINDGADLALPRYSLGAHEGLVNGALLYPLSHALFGVNAHSPLPLDVAFSEKMAARLAVAARKPANAAAGESLLWPAAEAATGALAVHEVHVGHRVLPQPSAADLNSLLAQVAGSLFADLEAKAAFWQRARSAPPVSVEAQHADNTQMSSEEDLAEVSSMAESFRNAYTNLQEIWSLVLPPQSLVALKKLSLSPPESFMMPANLWARTVYDFVLAYRLRTINRGHLLGALTPLYLAWAASHLRLADGSTQAAEQHIEETAAAFVAERPYVLARWRWPDRFNP